MSANGNIVRMDGKRFGYLTVLRREGSERAAGKRHRATWLCQCECGQTVVVRGDKLRQGYKKSCGLNGHHYRSVFVESSRAEKRVWNGMLQRCYNPKSDAWEHYGGRGIRVCKRWKNSFSNFLSDVGPRPSSLHSIDRFPDMNGNYEPNNCRWATAKEQGRNKRDTVMVVFRGETISVTDYAEKIGIKAKMIKRRLERGWSVEDALTTPSGAVCTSSRRTKPDYPAEWVSGEAFKKSS